MSSAQLQAMYSTLFDAHWSTIDGIGWVNLDDPIVQNMLYFQQLSELQRSGQQQGGGPQLSFDQIYQTFRS